MGLTMRFWGTRGSIPTPGAATVRYGGNTPCIEVRTSRGSLVILDAGTGIRALGRALTEGAGGAPIRGDIFLSHGHWDHVHGLPFFAPLFQRGNGFRIWRPAATAEHVDHAVRAQMAPGVFPVAFDEIEATVELRTLNGMHAGDGYVLETFPVRHPGGALGYKIRERPDGPALVYISDNELGDAPGYDCPSEWRERLVEFTRGAAVLVHDTMYTVEEYERHRGWGHSHYLDALELALDAGVERLVLFHYDPERTDGEIDRHLADCRAAVVQRGGRLEVLAAAEGLTLRLD